MSDTIGKRISLARRAAGFTQQDIAKKIGLSRSLIGQIEKDRSMPSLQFIIKYVAIVNISYQYLLEGVIEPEEKKLPPPNTELNNDEWQNKYIKSLEVQVKLLGENSCLKDEEIKRLKECLNG